MSADDFASLVADVKAHGQREPVILLDNMVLDGWHRYSACMQLGIEPAHFNYSGDDPVAFVQSQNLHRRHLTGSQRAAAIVACSEWAPPNRLKNKQAPGAHLPQTNAELASKAHVAETTIKQAKAAFKAGLGDAIKDGAMTVKEAAQIARGTPATPKSKPEVSAPAAQDEDMVTGDELLEQMQETQAENEQLQERVAVMLQDEKNVEIDKLLTRINGLEGRLQQAMAQIKSSEDTAKYHAQLIHKLRKLLGVEGHKEILAAVKALVEEKAEA